MEWIKSFAMKYLALKYCSVLNLLNLLVHTGNLTTRVPFFRTIYLALNYDQSPENLTNDTLNVALSYKLINFPIVFTLCT